MGEARRRKVDRRGKKKEKARRTKLAGEYSSCNMDRQKASQTVVVYDDLDTLAITVAESVKNGNTIFIVDVPRKDVEMQDLSYTFSVIEHFIENANTKKVGVVFSGYDDDQRELWEVAEVRKFVRDILMRFPKLLNICIGDTFELFLLCTSDVKMVQKGAIKSFAEIGNPFCDVTG